MTAVLDNIGLMLGQIIKSPYRARKLFKGSKVLRLLLKIFLYPIVCENQGMRNGIIVLS